MTYLLAVADKEAAWMTAVWILGLGALGAAVVLAIAWAICYGLTFLPGIPQGFKRFVQEVPLAINEGPLYPLTVTLAVLAGVGLMGGFVAKDGKDILYSLTRLPFVGENPSDHPLQKLEAKSDPDLKTEAQIPDQEIEITQPKDLVSKIRFSCNELVTISAYPLSSPLSQITEGHSIEVKQDAPVTLSRRTQSLNPLLNPNLKKIFVRNRGAGEAVLRITIVTSPMHSQTWAIPIMAGLIAAFYGFYFLQRTFMPRLSAIALSTYKSNVVQGFFIILVVIGIIMCFLFIYIPYNTMGEDIKMVKETGITLIRILAIIMAIWAASTSISDEIEGRTALTVLSKPIGRRSFVIGKFVGISWTTVLMFSLIGVFFLGCVAFKAVYDAKENSLPVPPWQLCHFEMISVLPGLFLAFLEATILTALSVAISTRLPMLINFIVCFMVYALGHLTPLVVRSSAEGFDLVRFFGQFIAVVFPNLDNYDVQAAVTSGQGIPLDYLLWATVYSAIYSTVAMLLALLMFEDRDLT